MQITMTIPKLTTIRAHWRWGLLAVLAFAFMLTWSSPAGAPSAEAGTLFQAEMSLDAANYNIGDTGLVSCDLPSKPTKCTAIVGEQFDIIVEVNDITSGYDTIITEIDVGGLIFKPGFGATDCAVNGAIKEVIWPDYVFGAGNCSFIDDTGVSGNVGVFAFSKAGKSAFLGPIVKLNVACPATPGSQKVTLVASSAAAQPGFGTSLFNSITGTIQLPVESVPLLEVDSLKINCKAAGYVGGIAELPEVAGTPLEAAGSSGSNTGLIAGIVAAIAAGSATLTGWAWYARRRR